MGQDGRRGGTVLLVEDDAANYELISDHLASAGFNVHGASDGSEALALAAELRPDVVVTDYDLPGADGCEVARRLHRDARGPVPRVVLITGHVHRRIRELARESGCDGFLIKPFHLDELVNEIDRVLALERKARGSLLIVEDDDDVRSSLCDFLEDEGYLVATAENGAEALLWLRAHPRPDAILLDLMMPVMDGFQFLDAQRLDPQLRAIPVVVLTAIKNAAAQLEVPVLLEKPISLPGLLGAIEAAHR